jgi:DNA replication and repair protein RecF
MPFDSVRTYSFRNLCDSEVRTDGREIFLIGENGQGKTNFLEALYFCSFASSFKALRDSEIIRKGQDSCSASASLSSSPVEKVSVRIQDGKKGIFFDGKQVADRKDILEVIPSIVFCHDDMDFISGPPERRRWFFDQTLSLFDLAYIDELRKYKKILKTRNALLKQGSGQTLDLVDYQLALSGLALMEKRTQAAFWFSDIFRDVYEKVSGIEGINVSYSPSWKVTDPEKIAELLALRRETDLVFGTSQTGPHRDRYVFKREGSEFSVLASTGQRRLLALLLRIAQARLFFQRTGKSPVLLLDDVLLELDPEKKKRFIGHLPAYQQAFFTFLPGEPYEQYRKDTTLLYHVAGGSILA